MHQVIAAIFFSTYICAWMLWNIVIGIQRCLYEGISNSRRNEFSDIHGHGPRRPQPSSALVQCHVFIYKKFIHI